MKTLKLIFLSSLLITLFVGCHKSNSIDMKQYRGAILMHRSQPFTADYKHNFAVHTFRLQDSVWTETIPYGFFANFDHGDTIK